MNTATFDQFVDYAREDTQFFNATFQVTKKITDRWVYFIARVVLFVPVLIFAQITPFVFRRHIKVIVPLLPYIQDQKALLWIKDAFTLYYHSLKGYRPFCLFRRSINDLIDELDEHLDSISFVIENGPALRQTIDAIPH